MADLSWLTRAPIAHRGLHDSNRTRWENTLPAFKAAVERGFAIECDLRLTSDGQAVVFHDENLDRLTGGQGSVGQKTLAELTAMHVGTTRDHIPTFAEVLEAVGGRVPLIAELKGDSGRDDGLVALVARLLQSYSGKAAIMSFDHRLVRQFPVHAPTIPCGLTATGDSEDEIEGHFSMLAYGISFVSYSLAHLPNPFTSFIRDRLALPLISWTVCDRPAGEKSLALADQMTFEGFEPQSAAWSNSSKSVSTFTPGNFGKTTS